MSMFRNVNKNLIDLPLPARLTDNIDEWVIWVAEQLEK